VFGWQRDADSLEVHFYDAASGAPRGDVKAKRIQSDTRVESFKIWPPQSKSILQIGRFGIPYHLQKVDGQARCCGDRRRGVREENPGLKP
jgi:hypothetical protein